MSEQRETDGCATLAQAIRNAIAALGEKANLVTVIKHLSAQGRTETLQSFCDAVDAMTKAGLLGRGPDGVYHLGSFYVSAADLHLTSPDAAFGQPSLF